MNQNYRNHQSASYSGRATRWLATLALMTGLMFLSAVPRAHANDRDAECEHRIAHADHQLHEAIEHHGAQSPQAEHARRDLAAARERCWNENHKWWDEDQHKWHDQRDWDEHDHDHI